MKFRINNNAGFTLVELLIASVLASLITFIAMDAYLTQNEQLIVQEQVSDMQQRGRAALDEIAYNLRQCGFNTPDSVAACVIGDNPNGPDTLTINHHGDDIIYYVEDSDSLNPVLIKDVNDNPQTYADGIEDLTVTAISSDLVQVNITARSASVDESTAKDYRRRTYSMRIKLRNL